MNAALWWKTTDLKAEYFLKINKDDILKNHLKGLFSHGKYVFVSVYRFL